MSLTKERGVVMKGVFFVGVTIVFAIGLAVCAGQQEVAHVTPDGATYQKYDRSVEKPCSPRRRDCK